MFFILSLKTNLFLSSSATVLVSGFVLSFSISLSKFFLVSIISLFLLVILSPTILYLFKKLISDKIDSDFGSGWLFSIALFLSLNIQV